MDNQLATQTRKVVDENLLFDCVHCGLCLEACPTYVVTRREMDSPRGRIYLMKALANGQLELEPEVVRHLDLCLGCRGCETACPSGVHYGQLIEQARAYVQDNYRRPWLDSIKRRMVDSLFPYPARVRLMLFPLRIVERLRMRGALEKLLPAMLREWLQLLPSLVQPSIDGTSRPSDAGMAKPEAPAVAIHPGCVAQVLAGATNQSAEDLLARAGYRCAPVPNAVCCGALDLHTGNHRRALELARANVRGLRASGADYVISTASGCSTAIAQYGDLLKDDPQLAEPAQQISSRVRELSSLLLSEPVLEFKPMNCTVTYHDACHLAHGMGIREDPRRLLRAIPGVRLVEMERSDLCCGSAGSYNLTEPEMARRLGELKADTILATDADYVVLANPGCQFQIASELRRRSAHTKIVHLADFVALALK